MPLLHAVHRTDMRSKNCLQSLLLLAISLGVTAHAGVFYSNFNPKAIVPGGTEGTQVGETAGYDNCYPLGGSATCYSHTEVATPFVSTLTGPLGSVVLPFFASDFMGATTPQIPKAAQIQIATDINGLPGFVLETMTYDGPFFWNTVPYPRLVGVNSALRPVLVKGTTYWISVTVPPNLRQPNNFGAWWDLTGVLAPIATLVHDEEGNTVGGVTVNCGNPGTPFPCNVWSISSRLVQQPAFVLSDQTIPSITTNSLSGALVGKPYSASLTVNGGVAPYSNWTVAGGTLPTGLTLNRSTGTISGAPVNPTAYGTPTFAMMVTDSTGASSPPKFFSISVTDPTLPPRFGTFAHLAAGGGWSTTISLMNTSSYSTPVTVAFHGEGGGGLNLPVTITQVGGTQTITSAVLQFVIGAKTSLFISTGGQSGATVVGWADVLSFNPVNGFAIFRQIGPNGTSSEGAVPLTTQFTTAITLPYDNTAGFLTGIALANLSSSTAEVLAVAYDENGTQLDSSFMVLNGNGHASFGAPDRLPLTGGKRGIVTFQGSADGLTGLGLRFSGSGSFTSVPPIVP